ncbi:MAG: hypothetical protein ACTSUE_26140 [Promethearchaeota archaeon]
MERKEPPEEDDGQFEDGKDLMKSTLVALGWEESNEDDVEAGDPPLVEQLQLLRQENDALQEKIIEQNKVIEDGRVTIANLKGEIASFQTRVEQGRVDQEEVSTAFSPNLAVVIDSLTSENLELKQMISSLQGEISELKMKQESTGGSGGVRAGENVALQNLEEENEELRLRVGELKRQVVDVIGENTSLSGEIQTKLSQLTQKEDVIKELDMQCNQLASEIDKLKLANDTIRSANESLKAEREAFQIRFNDLNNVLENQKRELLQNVSESSEGFSKLQQVIDEKDETINRLREKIEVTISKNQILKETIDELEKDKIGLKAILDKSSLDLEEFREKFYSQKEKIKNLELQSKENTLYKDKIILLQDDKQELEKRLESIEDEFNNEKKALFLQLENAKSKIGELEGVIKTTSQGKEDQTSTINTLREKINDLTKEIELLRAKNSQLEGELENGPGIDEQALQDLERKEKEHVEKIEKLEKKDQFNIERIEELERAVADTMELNMKFATLQDDFSSLKEVQGKLEKERDKYKRRLGEMASVQGEVDELRQKNKELKIQLKEMRRELSRHENP